MPFITGGFPSLDVTRRVLPSLEASGAAIVEVGFPFSDPIADGPVIAGSMHDALLAGVTPAAIFHAVNQVRGSTGLGLVAMVSDSIIQRMGPARFVRDAAEAGFDGLIVPDLDLERAGSLRELAGGHGLTLSLLVSQLTAPMRLGRLLEASSGFLYLLARAGITGEREAPPDIRAKVAQIRALTALPIAVGFGIASLAHVRAVTAIADAAIVGSALVRRMGAASDPVAAAASFIADLAGGLAVRAGESR